MAQTGPGWGAAPPRGWWPHGLGAWPSLPPKTGALFEAPARFVVPVVLGTFAASYVALWANRRYLQPGVETMTPEFKAAAAATGNVSQRQTPRAEPVYRNPIRNRIPGYVLGPNDLRKV